MVGLGGSATNDGGAGMLAALGAAPLDVTGYALPYGGAALAAAAALGGAPRLRGAALVAATDVDNPLVGLHGASNVYGPQKGAYREDVLLLDAALERFAGVLERILPSCPPGLAQLPGARRGRRARRGAARARRPGASRASGWSAPAIGLDAALDAADLVITGEGSFDHQSLRGKVVAGVAERRPRPGRAVRGGGRPGRAPAAGRPPRPGVTETYSPGGPLRRRGGGDGRAGRRACARSPPGWPRQWSQRSRRGRLTGRRLRLGAASLGIARPTG